MPLEMNLRRDLHRLPLSQDADSNAITDPIAYEEKIAPLVIPNAIPSLDSQCDFAFSHKNRRFYYENRRKNTFGHRFCSQRLCWFILSVRTRPKAFSTELLTFREGTSGNMASGCGLVAR